MKIKPLHNHVVIKQQDETETMYGNIVVPDLGKEKGLRGTIVSVGEGSYTVTGTFIPPTLKVGQKVILPAIGASKIEHDGQEYWSCPETQVLAIITE